MKDAQVGRIIRSVIERGGYVVLCCKPEYPAEGGRVADVEALTDAHADFERRADAYEGK